MVRITRYDFIHIKRLHLTAITVNCSLFSLNRLYVWVFGWHPYGKLTNSAFAGFFYAKIARMDTL